MKRLIVLATLLLLPACENKQEMPEPEEQTAPAADPIKAATEPEVEIAPDDVPTREDFEEEAQENITEENYEAELDELEKELETG